MNTELRKEAKLILKKTSLNQLIIIFLERLWRM